MKILIISDAWEPQVNGVVRTLKMTSRELGKLGHEVRFITPNLFNSFPCPTYPEISLALTNSKQISKLIDEFEPDFLHIATEGPLGWIARSIAIKRNWPFTTSYHSRFPEYVNIRFKVPVAWSYAIFRKFHNAAKANLAPTPAIVNDLKERGFPGARVWSRGVDFNTFSAQGPKIPRSQGPIFLHVGRLAVEKGIDEFLKLDLPGEKWIAGDGPERERLHSTYTNVRWFGVLDGPSLATLYRTADVFVFTSITDTFGLVMLESMACGTPVAAFPCPGPIDVVKSGESGVLDPDLKVACLKALEISRESTTAHAQTFSWERACGQFFGALHKIPR